MRYLEFKLKFTFVLLLSVCGPLLHADTLDSILQSRVGKALSPAKLDTEHTWLISGLNPIQYVEYRYGLLDEDRTSSYIVPRDDHYRESHMLRIHIKSFEEMAKSQRSSSLSRQLIDLEQSENVNQQRFEIYYDVVEQSLFAYLQKVLADRSHELGTSLKHSGQMMGMAKADSKDLVRDIERFGRVEADLASANANRAESEILNARDAQLIGKELTARVAALAAKLSQWDKRTGSAEIERKNLEVKLSRIDKEIGWAEDRKVIDHIDLQRDSMDRENGFRIGFKVPFLRFDNESRARDKALLISKESALARESAQVAIELRQKRIEALGLAAQVEVLTSRLKGTKEMVSKSMKARDLDLRRVLSQVNFALEQDVITQSLKFYSVYLELLRDQGAFSKFGDQNLLAPGWAEFKR